MFFNLEVASTQLQEDEVPTGRVLQSSNGAALLSPSLATAVATEQRNDSTGTQAFGP